ncbi:ABC transporter permease [Paenibacillus sp. N1-5-1-14]|uniref:FtsX-like permease family protein n=1 Tax=Paenibacillus radicibacter TaxID=2972488 RepID=UPI002158E826|nr:ABC transporter permease [Paenibacillus radicibacter]MCR8645980.1 ABC transporter permease [Paenibacillus radicibacter]
MLLKISLSSMRKMMKDYIVLLVGLVISISIFYMFQTLAMNEEFVRANSVIRSIMLVFNVGSVLLAIITFFYIFYANSFLLSLRRKEYGMYMMLGAKKSKIVKLMFIETMLIGIAALIIGILVGTGLASVVGQLLMDTINFTSDSYKSFLLKAVFMTTAFFIVIFLLTGIVNALKLSRTTILELIRAESSKESVKKNNFLTVILAILAVVCLAVGYYAILNMTVLRETGLFMGASATTVGTYLFFMTFLPVWVNRLKKNENRNMKGINSFTFAQLQFRASSLSRLLGTIAMLIALGVGAIAGGLAFQNNAVLTANVSQVSDIVIHDPSKQDQDLLANKKINEQREYRYKVTDKSVYFLKEDLITSPPLYRIRDKSDNGFYEARKEAEVLTIPLPDPLYSDFISDKDKSTTKATPLERNWSDAILTELNTGFFMFGKRDTYVADQNNYDKVKVDEHKVYVGYVDDFLVYKNELKEINDRQAVLANHYGSNGDEIRSKYNTYKTMHTVSSGTMFMGFFLGIAFLAMMASCLMFKILSGATRDIQRYQMLRKIGVRKQLLTKSIYKELLAIFVLPALIGVMHVLFGMEMFRFILEEPYFKIWLPIVIFTVIYAVYYFITVQLYKSIVLPKERL